MTENNEDIIVTPLRRKCRCLLNIENNPSKGRYLRGHLKYRCKIILGEKVDQQQIKMYEGKDEYLCQDFPQDCKDALNDMLKTDGNNKQRKALAHLFKLLSYDNSVDEILPLECCVNVEQLLQNDTVYNHHDFSKSLAKLRCFAPEVAEVSETSAAIHSTAIPLFLSYLIRFIINIQKYDISADEPSRIPGTYNPPRYGRGLYFSPRGEQLRCMRKFTIDVINEKKQKKNYDDIPDDENICEKIYPNVSKAGQSYLFVWLSLKHGECLGFHMIPGSEGRKDAHTSLYSYSEKVPKLIFSDHAWCNG